MKLKKKYNVIYSKLSSTYMNSLINTYSNIQIFFNLLLILLLNLNKNGSFCYLVEMVVIKSIADIILIGKIYF